ncbi:MAG: GNAT family N-acetyltransferase [Nitrosomonas sp.]|nr:GNAT family N-acetyltransferase [Nitrosomonas sp.]
MLQKIKLNLEELGALNTLLYLFGKVLYRLSFRKIRLHKYYITRQPVSPQKLVPINKALDIEIRQIDVNDGVLQQMDRPFSTLQARFNHGGNCFVALKKGRFAGNLWLNFDKYREDEVRCTYMLPPAGQNAWDYDVFVVPEFRFSYTFAKLWEYANTVMFQRGIVYVYSRVNFYNISSLRAHKKLGSKIIGSLVFITIGSFQISVSTRFKPYLTITIDQGKFPKLMIE